MQLLRVRPVTIYWVVFVVMSKEEGLCTVGRLHILVVLGRMSTSSNSVEKFQHWQKPKNEAIHNHAGLLLIR